MGADFLVVMTDLYGTVDNLKARIDAMTDEQVQLWVASVEPWFPGRYEMDEEGNIPYTMDQMREEIKIIVEELVGTPDARDISVTPIGMNQGWRYVSGGMSGGDSPTESFDEIMLVCHLSLSVRGGASVDMTMLEAFELLTLIEGDANRDSTLDNVEQQLIDVLYDGGAV